MCEVNSRDSVRGCGQRRRVWAKVFASAASDRDLTPAALAGVSGLPKLRIEALLSAAAPLMLTDIALLMNAMAMSGDELGERLRAERHPAPDAPVERADVGA